MGLVLTNHMHVVSTYDCVLVVLGAWISLGTPSKARNYFLDLNNEHTWLHTQLTENAFSYTLEGNEGIFEISIVATPCKFCAPSMSRIDSLAISVFQMLFEIEIEARCVLAAAGL